MGAIKMEWIVTYYVRNKNLYTAKTVTAGTAVEAIKKAKVKNIVEIYPKN
jgi:hypothetical protein